MRRKNGRRRFNSRYIRRTGRFRRGPGRRTVRGRVRLAQGKTFTSRATRRIFRAVAKTKEKKWTARFSTLENMAPGWVTIPLNWPSVGPNSNERIGRSVFLRYILYNIQFESQAKFLNDSTVTYNDIIKPFNTGTQPFKVRICVAQPKSSLFSTSDFPTRITEFHDPDSYSVIYDKFVNLQPKYINSYGTAQPAYQYNANFVGISAYKRIKIPVFKNFMFENPGDPTPSSYSPQLFIFSDNYVFYRYDCRMYYTDS